MNKIFLLIGILSIYSCKKEKIKITLPIIETQAVTEVLDQSAKSGGKIKLYGLSPQILQ